MAGFQLSIIGRIWGVHRGVRSGRSPDELAEKFEPTAQSIRNWVAQADRDLGRREDGLTTEEREDLKRLRREVKSLREEREILKNSRGLVRSLHRSHVLNIRGRSYRLKELEERTEEAS